MINCTFILENVRNETNYNPTELWCLENTQIGQNIHPICNTSKSCGLFWSFIAFSILQLIAISRLYVFNIHVYKMRPIMWIQLVITTMLLNGLWIGYILEETPTNNGGSLIRDNILLILANGIQSLGTKSWFCEIVGNYLKNKNYHDIPYWLEKLTMGTQSVQIWSYEEYLYASKDPTVRSITLNKRTNNHHIIISELPEYFMTVTNAGKRIRYACIPNRTNNLNKIFGNRYEEQLKVNSNYIRRYIITDSEIHIVNTSQQENYDNQVNDEKRAKDSTLIKVITLTDEYNLFSCDVKNKYNDNIQGYSAKKHKDRCLYKNRAHTLVFWVDVSNFNQSLKIQVPYHVKEIVFQSNLQVNYNLLITFLPENEYNQFSNISDSDLWEKEDRLKLTISSNLQNSVIYTGCLNRIDHV